MTQQLAWVPHAARGEWLRPMEEQSWGSILSVVPPGFEMYARVLHPIERDRPRKTEPATWADAAASFGTTMHRTAQYPRLVRSDYAECDSVVAPDGWRYSGPREGCLDAETLTTVAAVLARHTTTPHAGVAAIWEGWAGLPLSAEIAAGPRLELHGDAPRSYILFDAGAKDFADERWPERAPWVDDSLWAQSPSIIWPDDHAWVLATELDFDSTLIAGSTALVQDLVRTPGLEVHALPPDADLSWDGDTVNR